MQPSPELNESLGTYLKRARAEKSVSIEQVAYSTRISLKMLRALEDDEHTVLPAPTFVRGYLQAYAKYVRIDTQDLLLRYQHHLATAPDAKRGAIRSHYLYVRERYQEKRRLVLVIVLFATMLSVAGAYFFLKSQRDKHRRLAKTAEQIQKSENMKPSPPASVAGASLPGKEQAKPAEPMGEKKKTETAAAAPAVTVPAPQQAAKPPVAALEAPRKEATPVAVPPMPKPNVETPSALTVAPPGEKTVAESKALQLQLKASEDVWFRFQTDEDEVKDLTLRAGKIMTLRANKVFKIFSGNLGAIKATLNGSEITSLVPGKGIKSVVLPETEAPNYKLPLFPQFQVKHASNKPDALQNQPPSDSLPPPPSSENSTVPSAEQ
jgi:cytoskeleton protein RodZ